MTKVALVHDYLAEFGGAERVLLALSEMYPKAPIYTAFYRSGSPAYQRFKHKKIITSWAHHIPLFASRLHSPLRFLAPLIWESFDLAEYDLVISSASWYITKGVLTRPETLHISYIHTPPRYLYGYPASINWQKYAPIRLYARLVNHFLRSYDFAAARRPDILVANSQNVSNRIKKFYRRDAKVIYPPVELPSAKERSPRNYFLIVSRVVGGKGLQMAVQACSELGAPLKVVGEPAGWSREYQDLQKLAGQNVEFTGRVNDEELSHLYAGAKAFLATARDEDFGITPVEAMLAGTPVIAYRGGGYLETIVEGRTGLFFDDYSVAGLKKAIKKLQITDYRLQITEIKRHARKFSKQRFIRQFQGLVNA